MKRILFAIAFLMLLSCEEKKDWDLNPSDDSILVINAVLTNELKTQTIRLSKTFSDLNDEPPVVDNAQVSVSSNGVTAFFDHDTAGIYRSQTRFRIRPNLTYELKVIADNTEYTAQSNLSTVAPIPPITFKPFGKTDSLQLNAVPPIFNANQQAMYDVKIDWSLLRNEGITRANLFFYTFNSVDISEPFSPPREPFPFPKGSIVLVEKFGLNVDFADYLRALNIETYWNGTFFYSAGSNLPTNIEGGALGFFSTCATVKDTLIAR